MWRVWTRCQKHYKRKTNKVFLKRSGLTGPEAVTSQAMTCLQDNKKGSKLRPTPFTTLDEDAYYADNIAGNCKNGLYDMDL